MAFPSRKATPPCSLLTHHSRENALKFLHDAPPLDRRYLDFWMIVLTAFGATETFECKMLIANPPCARKYKLV